MPQKIRSIKKITCIIPAFNEEKQVGAVLDTALKASRKIPMEIIVVDDGSTDQTPLLLKKYKGIQVITNKQNKGKSHSVARGLEASKGEYILLLDSDLFGLTVENIQALLLPIQSGIADVTMSIRRNSKLLDSSKDKLDLMTGERAFPRALITSHIDEIKKLPNFGLEVFLNNLVIKQKYAIKAVHWNNVLNKTKSQKRGFFSGWGANIKAIRDVSEVVSFTGLVKQYIALKRLLVD